jgi:hypothetical protein
MFLTYDLETREVLSTAFVSREDDYREMLKAHGETWLELPTFDRDIGDVWIDDFGEVQDKKHFVSVPYNPVPQIRADDQDTFTYAGLPAGARVNVNKSGWVAIEDGTLELTAAIPGFYTIQLAAIGYHETEFVLEAVAV